MIRTDVEWLEWRRTGIGGSDAAAILGENPWKSNEDVWEEKVLGREFKINCMEAVEYGKAAERPLIELFKLDYPQYEVEHGEYMTAQHPDHPFLIATLDGKLIDKQTGEKGVLEVKTANILSSMSREKWKDQIPNNYYIQVLHYMMVTGFTFAILKAQLKSDFGDGEIALQTKHYRINRREVEADIAYLGAELVKFWIDFVVPKKRPGRILPRI